MARHNLTGKWGEKIAEEYLIREGYSILAHNWRLNHLEVDIIATKARYVVFVEVKTRSNNSDDPISAVTPRKMSLLAQAANSFIMANKLPLFARFDIIGITGDPRSYQIEHIPDAFQPPLRTYR